MCKILKEAVWTKIEPTGFCWLWSGKPNRDGYGVQQHEGKTWKAHRLIYTALIGEIPEDLELDHLCRVRNCVNPDHLEPVTHAENCRRSRNMGKSDKWKNRRDSATLLKNRTYCVQGHNLAEVGLSLSTTKRGIEYACTKCRAISNCKFRHKRGCTKNCKIQTYPLDTVVNVD